MTAHRNIGIIFFLIFLSFVILPREWQPFPQIVIFPWESWGMFQSAQPYHQATGLTGKTIAGADVTLDVYSFGPRTRYLQLEGNHLGWKLRGNMISNAVLAKSFCSWLIERYNERVGDSAEQLIELHITANYWALPPDLTKPPDIIEPIAQCTSDEKNPGFAWLLP